MIGKPLRHRIFWTWDHSMHWDLNAPGVQERGCSNPYLKDTNAFLNDYRRLIDFSAEHGFTGIVVWGFLRSAHGSVKAARELCCYGKQRGVVIIPGVGVNAYGGVFWEGRHRYNLATWLDRHPELEAEPHRTSRYTRMACPSRPANAEWMKKGVAWLCRTFDIGGINWETGDYGICQCARCKSREGRTGKWSFEDMAELLPPLIETAERVRPGMLHICECYHDRVHDWRIHRPLRRLPADTAMAFSFYRRYWERSAGRITREAIARMPPRQKILRTHIGSQWAIAEQGRVSNERYACVARELASVVKKAADTGMDGVTIFGEVSASRPPNEINYLSIAFFADNPGASWKRFVSEILAPRLGGEDLAGLYLRLVKLKRVRKGDLAAARAALLRVWETPAFSRWLWLMRDMDCRSNHGKEAK